VKDVTSAGSTDKICAIQLFTTSVYMRKSAHVAEVKKLTPANDFLEHSVKDRMPANTFVLLDTHSDELTGHLQHSGGQTNPMHTTVGELVTAYLGKPLLANMVRCSQAAKQDDGARFKLSGSKPWCEITTKSRGGRRGLFLVTCGPAIRQPNHFDEVHKLVTESVILTFDLGAADVFAAMFSTS
jgi:hypothetical protein